MIDIKWVKVNELTDDEIDYINDFWEDHDTFFYNHKLLDIFLFPVDCTEDKGYGWPEFKDERLEWVFGLDHVSENSTEFLGNFRGNEYYIVACYDWIGPKLYD